MRSEKLVDVKMMYFIFGRINKINSEMTASGSTNQSAHRFSRFFNRPDDGWYFFREYLDAQLANGHTSGYYDATANNTNWIGLKILDRAPNNLLFITQAAKDHFERTNPKRLMAKNSNPFRTETYWRQEMANPTP